MTSSLHNGFHLPGGRLAAAFDSPAVSSIDLRAFLERIFMKKLFIVGFIALAAVSAHAKDVVDTAVGAGNFKTLATALQAASLIDTLKRKGPR